ncbi:MAG: tripartite tricarboxylate transporter TctB family protein [Pseudomonadota bacterium]
MRSSTETPASGAGASGAGASGAGASGAGATRDRVAGAVLFALGLLIVWEARTLPFGSLRVPGAGMFPVALALMLAALGLLLALKGGGPALRALGWKEARQGLAIFGALAFAALALDSLGYRLTVAAVLLFLIGAVERKGWLVAALVAIGFALGSHALFADFLRVPLPRGPFGV